MGKGDKRRRKQSIGIDLAEVPRPKKRGGSRQDELDGKIFHIQPGRACVYAIEARGTAFLKIGVARNPYTRLKKLQTGNPCELGLLYAMEADERKAFEIETLIHRLPEVQNANGQGEWVDISPRIIPTLIAFAAHAVGAELVWRFGAPADEEPEDFEQWLDPLAKAASGFSVDRSRRKV